MRVTTGNLGAWVLRCNPALSDPEELFGRNSIDRWCVATNYRSRLMTPGQPVLFWLTGSRAARYPRGFWGSGTVIGPALFGVPASASQPAGDLHAAPTDAVVEARSCVGDCGGGRSSRPRGPQAAADGQSIVRLRRAVQPPEAVASRQLNRHHRAHAAAPFYPGSAASTEVADAHSGSANSAPDGTGRREMR